MDKTNYPNYPDGSPLHAFRVLSDIFKEQIDLEKFPTAVAVIALVLHALESAQQENKAWESIEAWSCRPSILDTTVEFTPPFESETRWLCTVLAATVFVTAHYGESRLEALTKAAEWCRAELVK